ncbi:MAG: lysophospholipid acyltransferase family protein [Gammaproteobacteria bacterium]|nr:lysophospholipid acyltransferase family protein [Gammaproteobacteria bacterium]
MSEISGTEQKDFPLKFKLILWALYIFCWLLSKSWRVRIVGMDRRRRAMAMSPSGACLIASFHENAIGGVLTHAHQKICLMISHSKDGELVAFVGKKMGMVTVRGSSSKGGKQVRDAMVDAVLSGLSAAITVDGPRGPRRVLKNGIVDIARKTGSPIIPIACIGESMWTLRKTWDQTRIPKPFTRLIVHYSEPIKVPKDLSEQQFSDTLTQVTAVLNRDDEYVRLRFHELWAQSSK